MFNNLAENWSWTMPSEQQSKLEIIALQNELVGDTEYGLAAGVWTRDINTAFRLISNIEAGIVWVNAYEDGDMTQPFGGYKQSGQARDKCIDSYKSYTQTKSAWIRLAEDA